MSSTHNSCCPHENTQQDRNIIVCLDCGEEIDEVSITNSSYTLSQYCFRPKECKNINNDVKDMGFPANIIAHANKLYNNITNSNANIYRNSNRKAIIFACIYEAYKEAGKPINPDELSRVFNIKKNKGLQGLKIINLMSPNNPEKEIIYITPLNLIGGIMDKFKATEEQKQEVCELYNKIKNKSTVITRARPQSVSAGLVYYWICQNKKDITIKFFTEEVKLSELTIKRISNEITRILTKPQK